MSRKHAAVLASASLFALVIAGGALAATGDLTPQGCIADPPDAAGCAATAQGLNDANDIAVSADGASVYAASGLDAAIVRFDRAASGALSNPSCIADTGDAAGCGTTAEGLSNASGVAVSSDGASVYAVSFGDSAIVRFDRAASGALSNPSCIDDPPALAGCAATAEGLSTAADVALSPDGASVYAVSAFDDAIVRFDRAANGALTPQGCISDIGDPAGCGAIAQGLDTAVGVAVSPDGASVYAASEGDDAIVRFDRAASGALSNPSCIADTGDVAGCGATAEGLNSAGGVAVSPDGGSVYAVSFVDSAIVRFDRAGSGALSNPSCIDDPPALAGCAATAQGLGNATDVAVSADGASVYAVSLGDDAIVRFDRAASGVLSNPSCVDDPPALAGCGATAQGLDGAVGVAVSPDGASVYAASNTDDAIVRFDRELATAVGPPPPGVQPTAADGDPPETTITKKPKKGTTKRRAKFEFISDEPSSSFECKLDKRGFSPCASPFKRKVGRNTHKFQVRAIDPSGNVDPTPARWKWTVKKRG
jgi:DNA-binding beta-propeller fold protein YncE